MIKRRHRLSALLASMLFLILSGGAHAQEWPTKSIRLIVPFPPGGGTDIISRFIGQKLSERLGQSVVIDNRPGAGGNIGTAMAAKAPADGYTLLMDPGSTITVNPSLYSNLQFDSVKDFAPVSLIAVNPYVVVVNPSVPANSIKELIALAKAKPGQLTFASSGAGQTTHMAGELFMLDTGVLLLHVPYKGGGPAIVDTMGGQTSMLFGNMGSVLPYIKAGKLRALAVTTSTRFAPLPDVPTVAESGVPGYDISEWLGLFAPAGTPNEIVDRLHKEVVAILKSPGVAEKLSAEGFEPVGSAPAEFAAFIREDIAKWAKVVKQANIRIE